MVISGFFDRISQAKTKAGLVDPDDYFSVNFFTISQFLYQAGVLIARSSMLIFSSKRAGLVCNVQMLLFFGFFIVSLWYIELNIWIIFPMALLCGILGGWGYLFAIYRTMDNY